VVDEVVIALPVSFGEMSWSVNTYYLRFIPPAPLNRGPSGCSTGVKRSCFYLTGMCDPVAFLRLICFLMVLTNFRIGSRRLLRAVVIQRMIKLSAAQGGLRKRSRILNTFGTRLQPETGHKALCLTPYPSDPRATPKCQYLISYA